LDIIKEKNHTSNKQRVVTTTFTYKKSCIHGETRGGGGGVGGWGGGGGGVDLK